MKCIFFSLLFSLTSRFSIRLHNFLKIFKNVSSDVWLMTYIMLYRLSFLLVFSSKNLETSGSRYSPLSSKALFVEKTVLLLYPSVFARRMLVQLISWKRIYIFLGFGFTSLLENKLKRGSEIIDIFFTL